jgi:FMN-dependent NADH-azoreductase
MLVITSRGGDYESEEMKKLDFEEPYLRVAFGFAGISDITFINAQPMDMGREIQKAKIKKAQEEARKIAVSF